MHFRFPKARQIAWAQDQEFLVLVQVGLHKQPGVAETFQTHGCKFFRRKFQYASYITFYQVKKPDGSGQHKRVMKGTKKSLSVVTRVRKREGRRPVLATLPTDDDDADFLSGEMGSDDVESHEGEDSNDVDVEDPVVDQDASDAEDVDEVPEQVNGGTEDEGSRSSEDAEQVRDSVWGGGERQC